MCISKILELSQIFYNLDNFETKWIKKDALIRNFEIIGEASNHVSDEVKEIYNGIEWNEIRGMRNLFLTNILD